MGSELISTFVQGSFALAILTVVFKRDAKKDRQLSDLFKLLHESIVMLRDTSHDCKNIAASIVGHADLSRLLRERNAQREKEQD